MKAWQYYPTPFINKSAKEALSSFPREKDITYNFLRIFWTCFIRTILKIYFRLSIIGRENIPQKENYVLAANHTSHLDAFCLSAVIPVNSINKTFAIAAKDYFFKSLKRSFLAAILMNAIPFDREKDKRSSLELCADTLKVSSQALMMFPEGTRSTDGSITPFKIGIGILTAGTKYKVVPAYIEGARQAWPKGVRFPKPKKIRVIIGKPLCFKHKPQTETGFKEVALETENAVKKLSASSHQLPQKPLTGNWKLTAQKRRI